MARVMHELRQGKSHGKRTHKQEVAIALKSAGMNRVLKRRSKRRSRRTR